VNGWLIKIRWNLNFILGGVVTGGMTYFYFYFYLFLEMIELCKGNPEVVAEVGV
jgi:hypothetical protein